MKYINYKMERKRSHELCNDTCYGDLIMTCNSQNIDVVSYCNSVMLILPEGCNINYSEKINKTFIFEVILSNINLLDIVLSLCTNIVYDYPEKYDGIEFLELKVY